MRPGSVYWATNGVYAGGPDVGQPTKVSPTVGQRGDGRYASQRPAPQVWNWERWEVGVQLEGARLMRLLNWSDTIASVATGGVGDGLYEPIADVHMVIDATGVALAEEQDAPGGFVYAAGVPPAGASAVNGPRCAHDGAGNRGWVQGLTVPPALGPYYSAAWGAWAAWGGPWR
jgi:hypothetical protein